MEKNKLIAEFMGGKLGKDGDRILMDASIKLTALKYHTSWDWLMPVVEKIENMSVKFYHSAKENKQGIPIGYYSSFWCYSQPIWGNKNHGTKQTYSKNKRESVYKAVVEFIKWYNENKEE